MRLKFSSKLLRLYKPFNRKRKLKSANFDYIAASMAIITKSQAMNKDNRSDEDSDKESESHTSKEELKDFFFGATAP